MKLLVCSGRYNLHNFWVWCKLHIKLYKSHDFTVNSSEQWGIPWNLTNWYPKWRHELKSEMHIPNHHFWYPCWTSGVLFSQNWSWSLEIGRMWNRSTVIHPDIDPIEQSEERNVDEVCFNQFLLGTAPYDVTLSSYKCGSMDQYESRVTLYFNWL